MENKEENNNKLNTETRVILGLDVSTTCIGATIVIDEGEDYPKIAKITHYTPKLPKEKKKVKGIESLLIKKQLFEKEFLTDLKNYYITDVVIEEPLLSSNNVNTVATLLRFNGMISESVYKILGLVPCFISSYDARMFSFPDLVSIRKYNKKGEIYPKKHIQKALKDDHLVLFGAYPFDVDKKLVMMNKVNEVYNDIEWSYNDKGELRKENFDACDSLICTLAYVNINHHGIEKPTMLKKPYSLEEKDDELIYTYTISIWDREYEKKIVIEP